MVQVVFLGGENDDGRVRHVADFPAHVQAALARQHQVEDDDFRLELEKGRQRHIATMYRQDLETVLGQEVRDQPGELLVIFHQQYFAKTRVIHKYQSECAQLGRAL
ncbi:hypothetical protein PCAU_2453 [Pseudomonas chlororaphis subsp. aurantiaca]|nr:hypothetical protein PCAU_2453 [Pseudomonas chlororaphis subsp. aurantiaca]